MTDDVSAKSVTASATAAAVGSGKALSVEDGRREEEEMKREKHSCRDILLLQHGRMELDLLNATAERLCDVSLLSDTLTPSDTPHSIRRHTPITPCDNE